MTKEKWRGCIIVSDHDRKLISVHGPMLDDTPYVEKVAAAQDAGRQVNCTAADPDYEAAVKEARGIHPTYKLVEDALRPTPTAA